ncbi:FMN-dependent NADH-azoreductase [Reinekea sp. G2M2-21]|uniref:FMN-dependent NADH-azoreductase n=1 Tax=Reinekea sp. G2M2-21 TaxID=2788942 RepID=UPI0018ABC734|nr:NAD(P)H-dependent oxidoreductase [Reinekea sp. G2M2-21]
MKILSIQSGIFGDHSNSTQLVKQVVDKLSREAENVIVTERDLSTQPLPYFDAEVAMALNSDAPNRTAAQQKIVALSDLLIEEVKEADAIVLGLPMYNFGIPAQMKSWFDLLARAGVTFTYTEQGPKGLLADKPVYVVAARGGVHQGQPSDSQTPFIRTILGFIGLQDVRIVYVEGLNMGDSAKAESLSKFETELVEFA